MIIATKDWLELVNTDLVSSIKVEACSNGVKVVADDVAGGYTLGRYVDTAMAQAVVREIYSALMFGRAGVDMASIEEQAVKRLTSDD